MSARITLHFYSRQGCLYTLSPRGWLADPASPLTFTAAADARRHALAANWQPGHGRRVFLRIEQAGRVDHIDLWRTATRPLPNPRHHVLALALAS